MQNAANIGSTQQNYDLNAWQAAQQDQLSRLLGLGGLASQIGQNQFGRNYALAGLTQGIGTPNVGLSPSDVAGITVGNSNMVNAGNQNAAAIQAAGAQGNASLGGGLLGFGLNQLAQNNMFAPTTAPSGSWAYDPNTYTSTWTK